MSQAVWWPPLWRGRAAVSRPASQSDFTPRSGGVAKVALATAVPGVIAPEIPCQQALDLDGIPVGRVLIVRQARCDDAHRRMFGVAHRAVNPPGDRGRSLSLEKIGSPGPVPYPPSRCRRRRLRGSRFPRPAVKLLPVAAAERVGQTGVGVRAVEDGALGVGADLDL